MVLLFPALALGGEVKYKDLVRFNGLYYKKGGYICPGWWNWLTNDPFTGEARRYFDNGKLNRKSIYKDGKKHGLYTFHNEGDGQCARTCHFHGTAGQYWSGTIKDGVDLNSDKSPTTSINKGSIHPS